MRVPSFLAEQHVPFETFVHPPAFTATRRAHWLHVTGHELAKSVLLTGPGGHLIAVVPATKHVDLKALASELGGPVELTPREEVARVFRDCEWGGLVPFGSLYDMPCLLDSSFASESWLVFEAHSHGVAIRMRCGDFERVEQPKRLKMAR